MFDKVLKPNITQEQVYNGAAKHIVKGNVLFILLFELNCFDEFFIVFLWLGICNQSVLTRFLL